MFVVFVVISIILSIGVNSEDRASSKSLLFWVPLLRRTGRSIQDVHSVLGTCAPHRLWILDDSGRAQARPYRTAGWDGRDVVGQISPWPIHRLGALSCNHDLIGHDESFFADQSDTAVQECRAGVVVANQFNSIYRAGDRPPADLQAKMVPL